MTQLSLLLSAVAEGAPVCPTLKARWSRVHTFNNLPKAKTSSENWMWF